MPQATQSKRSTVNQSGPNKTVKANDEARFSQRDDSQQDTKSQQSDTQTETKKLKELAKTSHELLASATTVFPLTLFPDTVTIDRNKVNIRRRRFFFASDVMGLNIEEISNVSSSVGPLFGSLGMAMKFKPDEEITVNNFWKHDAIRLKRILQGYITAIKNEVDCSKLPKDKLLEMLYDLGKDTSA